MSCEKHCEECQQEARERRKWHDRQYELLCGRNGELKYQKKFVIWPRRCPLTRRFRIGTIELVYKATAVRYGGYLYRLPGIRWDLYRIDKLRPILSNRE